MTWRCEFTRTSGRRCLSRRRFRKALLPAGARLVRHFAPREKTMRNTTRNLKNRRRKQQIHKRLARDAKQAKKAARQKAAA